MPLFDGQRLALPRGRIGLVPGSFNPPHAGHAELAEQAAEYAQLDTCVFYVNSICQRKRREFVSQRDRVRLLEGLLKDTRFHVISPDFFPDNPGGEFLPQEQVFLPLIAKLVEALGSTPEVWLVRGSDNFRPACKGGYRYPNELRAYPHVIGLRSREDDGYDYSQVEEKLFVRTTSISSTEVRADLRSHDGETTLLSADLASYIASHHLFQHAAGEPAGFGDHDMG
jgi:cytidyltransferase-like protein